MNASAPARFRLGLFILLAGLVVAGLTGFGVVRSFPDIGSWPRATGQDPAVELQAGDWTVFVENGTDRPDRIEGPDGSELPVRSLGSTQTYSIGSRSGRSVGAITAPTDGTYTVTPAAGTTIAFGQGFGRGLVTSIVTAFVGGVAALAMLIGGAVVVLRSRRR